MAQPTDQKLLDTGHAFYGYFWYANGSGLWDARNGAMATKTGTGAVTATGEGGTNVANSAGTTYYSTGALTELGNPCTVGFKVKRTSAAGDKGVVLGDRASSNYFFWIRASEVRAFSLTTANSNPDSWATFHYVRLATGFGKLYKNGSYVADVPWTGPRTINAIMDGFAGGTLALDGALEYMHIIPGLEATAGQVASLYADPYQALAAAGGDGSAAGTLASITISPATATATGTGGANGDASGTPAAVSLTAPTATAAGSAAGSGTITTPTLKNNTGTVLASISGWTVNVYNVTTGAFIVQKTGLTTSAGGVLTITDASIVSGTTYAYEPFHATYGRRLPTSAAV